MLCSKGAGKASATGDSPCGQTAQRFMGGDIPRAVIGCAKGFKRVAPSGQREANICWRVCVFRAVIALEMRKPRFKHVKLKGTRLERRKARSQIQVCLTPQPVLFPICPRRRRGDGCLERESRVISGLGAAGVLGHKLLRSCRRGGDPGFER